MDKTKPEKRKRASHKSGYGCGGYLVRPIAGRQEGATHPKTEGLELAFLVPFLNKTVSTNKA